MRAQPGAWYQAVGAGQVPGRWPRCPEPPQRSCCRVCSTSRSGWSEGEAWVFPGVCPSGFHGDLSTWVESPGLAGGRAHLEAEVSQDDIVILYLDIFALGCSFSISGNGNPRPSVLFYLMIFLRWVFPGAQAAWELLGSGEPPASAS